ncbi:MAG: UDP-N-acetylmuramoyl-L-alanine--D-glutamate ligase [Pseudomonadales bacterium]|nr:UDP-N-acetylmuramoyl-L-alanine--D-glutamate ligase [Pseudomonadales bacterium]NRA16367.1 UDP-N-acetylmuramoyl-L-alanine--D-glutamate ligase [Oceanospirillaceae bacterium]
MSLIATDQLKIVIGLGVTGISCAQLLAEKGENFIVVDTREKPPKLEQFRHDYPQVKVLLGPLDAQLLSTASELILSPGIAKDDPAIVYALNRGAILVGDIDLFCRQVSAPILAISGSNAKSTVTTLVGEMAKCCHLDVGVGGNIGTPVLDFLQQPEKDVYVLELSSFQLETANDLRAKVATVLNITPDHLDRYDNDFQKYYQAKHRIFKGCENVVENLDDVLTHPLVAKKVQIYAYHLGVSDFKVFGLLNVQVDGEVQEYLALAKKPLLATNKIKLPGRHNIINALAALSIGHAAGFEMQGMLKAIENFQGLEHRCQWVANKQGVDYFNDSKGTNVGATVAALEGLGATLATDKKIVLIAGGDGKGADFDDLAEPVALFVKAVILIGADAKKIAASVAGAQIHYATDMQDAVRQAAALASAEEIVLLSPACASFDMFTNYEQRGHVFSDLARKL